MGSPGAQRSPCAVKHAHGSGAALSGPPPAGRARRAGCMCSTCGAPSEHGPVVGACAGQAAERGRHATLCLRLGVHALGIQHSALLTVDWLVWLPAYGLMSLSAGSWPAQLDLFLYWCCAVQLRQGFLYALCSGAAAFQALLRAAGGRAAEASMHPGRSGPLRWRPAARHAPIRLLRQGRMQPALAPPRPAGAVCVPPGPAGIRAPAVVLARGPQRVRRGPAPARWARRQGPRRAWHAPRLRQGG